MNIRPKTVRRLSIVVAVCGVMAAAAGIIVHFSNAAKERQLQTDHTEGMEAFQKGDYPAAAEKLRAYVNKNTQDYDAMYALAVSSSRVEGGRHLGEARNWFEELHNEKPDDEKVSHNLLQLYDQFGYTVEATRIADELLAHNAKDMPALRAKANVAVRAGKTEEALAIAQKLNDADPLDLDGQIQTYNLLCQLKRPAAEIIARYQAMLDAHPDDPRFEVLLGLAYLNAKDETTTLKWFRAAAKLPPPDAAFVRLLSRYFDQLRLFGESRELLERAAADGKHPELVKVLIERLWESGRFQMVVDKLSDLNAHSDSTDADLLAFKAISLDELGKVSDADAIIAALKARTADNNSAAWAVALETRRNPALSARDAIARYQDALARVHDNGIIISWMGEAYFRLGENGMAIQQWMGVADLMPSWGHPWVLVARAELLAGQVENAMKHAFEALRRAPGLVESRVVVARAWYQHLQQRPDVAESEKLIAFIQEIQKGIPGEQETLPLLVDLQAETGKRAEAIQAIRDAVQPDAKPGVELLLRLMEVSRKRQLGLEDELAAKLPSDTSASPRLALSRAMDLAEQGKAPEGLSLLSKAASAATTEPVRWQTALAEYREATHDPEAKAAWIALGDANPNDIAVQMLLIQAARSAVSDRPFFARTIQRIHDLTGDDAIGWKIAQARYLLTSDDTKRDSAQAVDLLRTIVGQFPEIPEYRVLLAQGLLNLGNTSGAIDHFKAAVERDPTDVPVMLNLVRLLKLQNRMDESRGYLDRAAQSQSLSAENRAAVALALTDDGQIPKAVAILRDGEATLEPRGELLLAELLRNQGAAADAETIYAKLLQETPASADAIMSAADFYASANRLDQAKQIMAKLDDTRFSKTERAELLGRFDELYAGVDAARDQFVSGTELSPADPQVWQALIEFYIRQNHFDDAITAADKAMTKVADISSISTLKAKATALKTTKADSTDLQPLIDALSKDPSDAPAMEMLKAIADAKKNRPSWTQLIAKLKPLSEKYPNYYPLQSRLLQAYVSARLLNNAASLAEHLMDARPNDPEPARQAVTVYQLSHRWRDMKRAADRWRQRTLSRPNEADIAMAEAMLQLGDTKGAGEQLAPYSKLLSDQPEQNAPLMAVTAEWMLMVNRPADAQAMLQPLLRKGLMWRQIWLGLAADRITPAATATEWIRSAAAASPDDPNDQFEIAKAWQAMGARLNDADAMVSAKSILGGLTERPDAAAEPMVLLAGLDADAGDTTSAEALYRKALKIRAQMPDALNNLSFLLVQRGGDMNEAKELVEQAIALSPNVAAFHDTLARVNEKLNRPDVALSEFQEAVRLDPESIESRIGLARSLAISGKREEALKELRRIDSQMNGHISLPPSASGELDALRQQLNAVDPNADKPQ